MDLPLTGFLRTRVTDEAWQWLDDVRKTASQAAPSDLVRAFTAAPGKLGRDTVVLDSSEHAPLAAAVPGASLAHWSIGDLGRAVLLAGYSGRPDFVAVATDCFEQGDSREQQSWMRALPFLPQPERFLALAIDTCRTSIVQLFEAIACENAFPAQYFPERNFNQLVLTALFNSIALERIVGITTRFNVELSRMADDYVSEREAAGRPVPQDIWLVLAPCIHDAALPRVRRYLDHLDPGHRRWAAEGLRHR